MVKVKICGLRRALDIHMVNRHLPDYAGFVFANSPRRVTQTEAEGLSALLDKRIVPVGVFVNQEPELIVKLCRKGTIRAVQLHGEEEEAYIARLRAQIPRIPLIKAVRVQSTEQILAAQALDCEFLLLDTYTKGVHGGSGQQFDKTLIPPMTKPYFLAGGLSAQNMASNLSMCSPYGVDVSSAVETEGVKDEAKIKELIERVRSDE